MDIIKRLKWHLPWAGLVLILIYVVYRHYGISHEPLVGLLTFVVVFLLGVLTSWIILQEFYQQVQSGQAKKAVSELFMGLDPKVVARTFAISVLLIISLPIIFTRPALFNSIAFNKTGSIGDTIGGIMGPFIAIIAAWLTYKAFVMQYYANQQIKNSSDKSRFETNFFQLLALQQQITQDLILYTEVIDEEKSKITQTQHLKHVKLRGREAIRQIYEKGTSESRLKMGAIYINYGGVLYNIETQGYNYMAQNEDLSFLDHYFRHLYRIVKYVDDARVLFTLKERYEYVSLLRAQLSDYELGLVFYNCLSDNGREKFKPLAERYALFNNIRDKVLNDPQSDKRQYDDKAFEFDEKQNEDE